MHRKRPTSIKPLIKAILVLMVMFGIAKAFFMDERYDMLLTLGAFIGFAAIAVRYMPSVYEYDIDEVLNTKQYMYDDKCYKFVRNMSAQFTQILEAKAIMKEKPSEALVAMEQRLREAVELRENRRI